MFFQGWSILIKTVILSVLMYVSIIIIIRTSGKRTLSTFNAFDFLITVAMGSISATTILSKNTKFFDGISSIIVLVFLQFLVAKLSAYSKTFSKIIKSEPTLLYYNHEYLEKNMVKMRVSRDDILQEARVHAGVTLDKVHSVILEANGKMSIVTLGSDHNLEGMIEYK